MLGELCSLLNRPHQTNHSLRASAVIYMRRTGLAWEMIAKITGHKRVDNLVKNYDTMLEAQGFADVATAIATAAAVALGQSPVKLKLSNRQERKRLSVNIDDGQVDEGIVVDAAESGDNNHLKEVALHSRPKRCNPYPFEIVDGQLEQQAQEVQQFENVDGQVEHQDQGFQHHSRVQQFDNVDGQVEHLDQSDQQFDNVDGQDHGGPHQKVHQFDNVGGQVEHQDLSGQHQEQMPELDKDDIDCLHALEKVESAPPRQRQNLAAPSAPPFLHVEPTLRPMLPFMQSNQSLSVASVGPNVEVISALMSSYGTMMGQLVKGMMEGSGPQLMSMINSLQDRSAVSTSQSFMFKPDERRPNEQTKKDGD